MDIRQDGADALSNACRSMRCAMGASSKVTLHTMLGNYANVAPLKKGALHSDLVDFSLVEVKVANKLFKQVVRDAKYADHYRFLPAPETDPAAGVGRRFV